MTRAQLIDNRVPRHPDGVVLVLHGGASRSGRPEVSPAQLSVLRMLPVAARIARAGRGRLAVLRLLNSSRGWDAAQTPVDDVAWAMARVRERLGDLPTCLVGHSLGGRAALLAASQPGVRGVVALNPWLYPDDPREPVDLTGRRVLFVHGTDDRVADPERSRRVASRLAQRPDVADVEYVEVPGGRHAMLRHAGAFEVAAADFAVATLLGGSSLSPAAPRGPRRLPRR
jgi:alpha-beta hydrolase superfamily lysophospholipase